MNWILRCDWLWSRPWAKGWGRRGEGEGGCLPFKNVPSRQDRAILPGQDYLLCPTRKISPNPLLIKLVQSRWLDIGLVLFLWVYGPWLLGPETHRKELSQYPAILTSHLVNNQDIYDRYFINLFRAIEVGCSCINYLMVLHPAWLVILATVLSSMCMAWHKFKILGMSVYI